MQATFDNKTNILNARIRTVYDNSILYSLRTTSGFRGRKLTILQDANPLKGNSSIAGAIHWQDKAFEIHGQKKFFSELKRHEGGLFNRSRHWCWAKDRKEYEVNYHQDEWKATFDHNMSIAARFSVPFRPHLFTKSEPAVLNLTRTALAEDEVFLILIFIYSEAKRQDKTNSSLADGGAGGW